MSTTSFPLLGEPLALDLANTLIRAGLPDEQDLLVEPAGLVAWCAAQAVRLADSHEPPAGQRLIRLREAVRTLVGARLSGTAPDHDMIDRVNAVAAHGAPRLSWSGSGPQLVRAAGPEHPLLVATAVSAIELVTAPDHVLRTCVHPRCTLVFANPHGRRRWCSAATCGNRARAARHYARHHD